MGNDAHATFTQARDHLADLLNRADRDDTPTVITRRGRELAAVVSMGMLRRYQALQEAEDLRLIDERANSDTVPLSEVLAETLARPE